MKQQQFVARAAYRRRHSDVPIEPTRLEFAPEGIEPVGAEGVTVGKSVGAEVGAMVDAQHRAMIARRRASARVLRYDRGGRGIGSARRFFEHSAIARVQ